MKVKLIDVDDIFLGDDDVDRMFLGDVLIWGPDTIPELEASEDVYYDWSGYTP